MKKIAALMLSAVLMLTALAGCSQDSKAVLTKALAKTNGLTSFESQIETTAKLGMNGAVTEVPSSARIKCVKNGDDLAMEMVTSTEIEGQAMETTVYYDGGFMYMSPMGQKMKMAVPMDDAEEMATLMTDMTADMIKEVTSEKVDNGTKYTIVIDESKLSDFAGEIMTGAQSSLQNMPGADNLENFTCDKIETYVVVGADGYAVEQWIAADISIIVGEGDAQQELKTSMVSTNTFINPGTPVTVNLPEDLAEYQEVNAAAE